MFQFFIEQFFQKKKNIIVVNIGGISNFTFLNGKKKNFSHLILVPGNILIDTFVIKILTKVMILTEKLQKKEKLNLN